MEYLNNLVNTLSTQVGNLIPGLLGAVLALIIGFIIARIVRTLTKKVLSKTNVDEKLGNEIGSSLRLDEFIAKLMYYLVLVYTMLVVLNLMGVTSVLEPIQAMLNNFLGYLPNLLGAGVISFAGYLVANIASEASGFLSEKIESISSKNGVKTEGLNIPKLIKQIVFIFVFIPILIVALDTLKMNAISEPAKEMLQSIMSAIPNIIAAILILGIFYAISKYLVNVLVDILKNTGLDSISKEAGVSTIIKNSSLSEIIGTATRFFIMFLGTIAAADKLNLGQVSDILNRLFTMSGSIFIGLSILFLGFYISQLAVSAIDKESSFWLKPVIRFTILGLFFAFGLNMMGIADNVVNLAFGLTLGAVAGAFVLSFGLGGREAAGKQMEYFFEKMRNS